MVLMDYFYQPQVEAVVEYYNDYVCPVPDAQAGTAAPDRLGRDGAGGDAAGDRQAAVLHRRLAAGVPDAAVPGQVEELLPVRERGGAGCLEQPVPADREWMIALRLSTSQVAGALAGARPVSYWLDQPDAPRPEPALAGRVTADLAVIGGGFTGLWTALQAKEADPDRDVVLLEGARDRVGRYWPEWRVLLRQASRTA